MAAYKKDGKSGVYMIISPKNKKYIGSSTNIDRRFYQYGRMCEKAQKKLYNSFLKYGVENHRFLVIEYCDFADLFKIERQWGDFFNTLDRDFGLNLVLPGYGDIKKEMSQETKDKIGNAHRGKTISLYQRMRISEITKGKKQSKEHIEKRKMVGENNPAYGNTWRKGVKHTMESKQRMSDAFKGRWPLGKNPNSKNVIDHKTGVIYSSAKQISIDHNINYSTLKAWLQGVNPSDGRYEYVRD